MPGGVHEPDGVIRRDGVEIRRGDVAAFGEFALVPAGAGDPFAKLDNRDLGLHAGDDFRYRSGIRELDAVELFNAAVGDVGVGVDEAGGGCATVEVDDAGAGGSACEFQYFGVGADLHDNTVTDGESLGYRVPGVYGENVAVKQDEVGGKALRGEDSSQQQDGEQGACRTELAAQRHRWILLAGTVSSTISHISVCNSTPMRRRPSRTKSGFPPSQIRTNPSRPR